jgi:DNA-binding MarR family transcriptional regulator
MAETSTQTRWLDAQQQASWRAFLGGTTVLFDRLDRDLRATIGIALPEYEILVRLSESPQRHLRMAVLAASLAHSRSRVTHTVARLERLGAVERTSCDTDGRGVLCQMTDAGWELLKRAAHIHVTGVREYLVDVAEPDDLAAVGRVFSAVSAKLGAAG